MQLTERLRSETCEKNTESGRRFTRIGAKRGDTLIIRNPRSQTGRDVPGNSGTVQRQVSGRPDVQPEKTPVSPAPR